MAVLLITYQSSKVDPQVDPVPGVVKNYKHIRLSDGTFAIETDEKTLTVYRKIVRYLGLDAQLFVVTLTQPFTFGGLDHENNWLWKHIPEY
jgi:hypothetical protein